MYRFCNISENEQKFLISIASENLNLRNAAIEKDIWICIILDYLFHFSPWKKSIAFKGGTSLSKAYNIINRFSEDIDLILDWRLLGYSIDEPWKERSKSQQDKFNKEANNKTKNFIKNVILPKMNIDIENLTGYKNTLFVLDDGKKYSEHTIVFKYPVNYTIDGILPFIRLEFGMFAAWTPLENKEIVPYIYQVAPNILDKTSTIIRTTSIDRAFWEKAVILHKESNRPIDKKIPERYARHYYDLFCIYKSKYIDILFSNIDILQKVIAFDDKFYHCNWANVDMALPGTFKLMPPEYNYNNLRNDYKIMQSMIYGDRPNFDELMNSIKDIEIEINSMTKY